ncbi:Crp/Fnr family transcriptional regulator [Anaerocolumna cellulosilytica]|uniref:Crp/Fnr family transcriptional regulator n=1 Tax=Anaerocolumna cellulosilytica TaxID=433286 RepID=A0A6S6R2D5_9FIRM|nr:Crp/Fnr family transcriptional regulator [Anaerocolumna cellulosilytica]MBB5196023.1 CRP-like cAMP-binding protein [Anaerocolumna cellulosilytica]BCJ93675.1 Crp/Fnr family transcriptional regulator [Anaerocolumna cellulosilytica]
MNEMVKDYIDEYSHIPLFVGISKTELISMMECLGSYIKTYKKSEIIILVNQKVKCVGVVLAGSVMMIKEDIWGNKTILAVIEKGEVFGETFACGSILSASVTYVAGKEARILYLPFNQVMHTCTRSCVFHHRLIENMVTAIANKNIQLMEKLEITTKKTLREKISSFLSIQAQRNNSKYFTVTMGRTELAEYLCADRSALTRELNTMKKEGLIDFEKNTFKIVSPLMGD